MSTLLAGRVKFFDSRPDKRYGFIVSDDGGHEIWFHVNDRLSFKPGTNGPVFDYNHQPDRVPMTGDRVLYIVGDGRKGKKATPWGYEADYQYIMADVTPIAQTLIYRIKRWFRTAGDGQDTEHTVIWTGQDLYVRELGQFFNPIFDRNGGNGDIDWFHAWEISSDGGQTWTECSCPQDYLDQFDSHGTRRIHRR